MIVYGERIYGKRNIVKGWGYCDRCGRYAKNTTYSGRLWQHLYFIPLIPSGERRRVLKECRRCSHGLHLADTDVPSILHGLRQSTEDALLALISGEDTFDHHGTTTSSVSHLVGAVEMLLCLEAGEHLQLLLGALQEKQLTYAQHLVEGQALEFQGKLDEAIGAYTRAANLESEDPRALLMIGDVHFRRKHYQAAKELYEQALERVQFKLPLLQVLLVVYESLQDHTRLVETYEQCFEYVPELARDKKVFKSYTKSCKRAGRQPIAE